jgi:hypothetical protein
LAKNVDFMLRLASLPEELKSAFLDDIEAIIDERLVFFEKLAKKGVS